MTDEEDEMINKHGTTKAHISDLKAGDTVIHDGELKTVGRESLSLDSFMGLCIFGSAAEQIVKKVNIKN